MSDIFSKEKRHEIMSSIKSKNTSIETIVFRYLSQDKIYFQKNYRHAPGCPDIALPRKKKAVFLDGDYWHGRDMSKTTKCDFWINKINNNIKRDNRVNIELKNKGWKVLRIWGSDIKRLKTRYYSLESIKKFLLGN